MRVLADTNVLVRLTQPSHSFHAAARQAVEAVRDQGDTLCIVPQIVYEYWAVCTRPVENNGLGMSVELTRVKTAALQRVFRLLRDERSIFDRWEELVARFEVRGKNTHDARLAAAMVRHGITHVLTFDAVDFRRFSDITVLEPGR